MDEPVVPPIIVTTIYGEKICLACECQWEPCPAHRPPPVSTATPLWQWIPSTFERPIRDHRTPLEKAVAVLKRYSSPVNAWRNWSGGKSND